jgi:hypothetical protein
VSAPTECIEVGINSLGRVCVVKERDGDRREAISAPQLVDLVGDFLSSEVITSVDCVRRLRAELAASLRMVEAYCDGLPQASGDKS